MSKANRLAIRKGSKSFFLASLFFSEPVKKACWSLYRWCRHCDDIVDQGGNPSDLKKLKNQTLLALQSQKGHEIFKNLGEVCELYLIPAHYPLELLEGFEKDIEGVPIQSGQDLEKYAYQVAGVVGMMMAHIMKAHLPQAARAAQSMGNAMQLTNIARDIREDYERGRIYLPTDWLNEENIDVKNLLSYSQREHLFKVIQRLLNRADQLYQEGFAGLKFLPLRSALAVSIAASIYSAIGRKILRKGPSALDSRTYVTLPEKLLLVFEGVYRVLKQSPERLILRRSHANA